MKKFLYFLIISSIIAKNFAGDNDDGPSQRRRGKRPLETVNNENLPKSRQEKSAQESPAEDFIPDFDALNITPEELDSWLNSAVHFNSDGENDGESTEDSENIPDFEELGITPEEMDSWLNPEVNFNVGEENNEEVQSSSQHQNDAFDHPFPVTIESSPHTNLQHQQSIMIGHQQPVAKQFVANLPMPSESAAAVAAMHLETGKSTKFEAVDYADLEIFTEVYDLWLKAIYGENYLDSADGQQNPPSPEFDLDALNPIILESSSNIEKVEPPSKMPKHASKTTKKKSKAQQAMAKNPDSQNPINVREQRKKEAAQKKQAKKEDAQRRKNGKSLKNYLKRQRMILQKMMVTKKAKRDKEESRRKAAAEGQSMPSNMGPTIEAEMSPSTTSNLGLPNSTIVQSPSSTGAEIADGLSHSAEALHHYRPIQPRPIPHGHKTAVHYISVPSRALLQKEKAKMRQEAIHHRPILPRPIPQRHETAIPYVPVPSIFQKEKAKLHQGLKIRHYLLAMIDQALAKLHTKNQQLEQEFNIIYTKSWEFEMNANEKMVKKLRAEKSAIMDRRVELNKNIEIMKAERCKVMDQIGEKNAQIARLNVD